MHLLQQYLEKDLRPCQEFPFYLYPLTVQGRGPHVPAHWHDEVEIIIPSIAGCLEANGLLYPFKKGDILFVNSGQLHSTSVNSGGKILHMVFHLNLFLLAMDTPSYSSIGKRLLNGDVSFPNIIYESEKTKEVLSPLLSSMYCAAKNFSPSSPLVLAAVFYQLLAHLHQENLLTHLNSQVDYSVISYVRNAMDYIQQHLDSPLRINEIASFLGISQGYFSRIFKQYTHTTPAAYTMQRKLESAHAYLLKGYTVTQAAQRVGTDNISYFIKQYKKKYKTTPHKTRITAGTSKSSFLNTNT